MNDFPLLLNLDTHAFHAVGASLLVGRSAEAEFRVLDETCSRRHFRIARRGAEYFAEVLQTHNPTYHDGLPVTEAVALTHGSVLQAGRSRFQFLLAPADAATFDKLAALEPAYVSHPLPNTGVLEIGRDPSVSALLLLHPQVSRRHAVLTMTEGAAQLTDLGSANGTFINGERISAPTPLQIGDQIDLGPFALQFTGSALVSRPRCDNLELRAQGVQRVKTERRQGSPLKLLDGIDLVIRPREFACVLGPSGSGKSTLLTALSGRTRLDAGVVLVNGADLHADFEALKQSIAVVPQQEAFHDTLTVEQALTFIGRLRLPADTSEDEIGALITEILGTVNLTAQRHATIRSLSGGERKRVSLANETLCKPSLILLDEVTSGLDEQTDRDMMRLFRTLADAGKTVVCVTHTLANVERTCHLLVILARGGVLAFVGTPADALAYFRLDRLADVYDRLAEQSAAHWQQAFRASPYWQRYVAARLALRSQPINQRPLAPRGERSFDFGGLVRQTFILTRRYAAIWRGDPLALAGLAAQAIVIAGLLALLFGNLDALPRHNELDAIVHSQRTSNLLFLLAVTSFWFGCNNSAKEIVKERTIFTREFAFNLRIGSYYFSKLLFLTGCSAAQVLALWAIVWLSCRAPTAFGATLVILLALALAGVAVGLALSSFANTEQVALTLVPLAILPQIILAGAIAPLEGASHWLAAALVTLYWGKQALDNLDASGTLQNGLAMLFLHTFIALVLGQVALYVRTRQKW